MKSPLTIKIVPHGTQSSRSFQVNRGALAFVALLFAIMISAAAFMATGAFGATELASDRDQETQHAQARMESVLAEIASVLQVSGEFDGALDSALSSLTPNGAESAAHLRSSALSLADFANLPGQTSVEVEQIRALSERLRAALEPMESMSTAIAAQDQLMREIPNTWPVIYGRGRVTLEFGPNIHPLTDQWYIHKGFDIADVPGIALVATADGIVEKAGTEPTYGKVVWIRHKYGFQTRYAHMQNVEVSEGQRVSQGQRLGTMGSTGLASGTHVHLEIWLGQDVLDPAVFLKISNEFRRWYGNR